MQSPIRLVLVLTAPLAACQATPERSLASDQPAALDASMPAAEVMPVAGDEVDSVWIYLSERYDADGDGTITLEEYDRDGGDMERVDRNRDGVVTADDFENDGTDMDSRMGAMRAQVMLARYFQADEDFGLLERAELDWRVTEYDHDFDESISQAEFDATVAELELPPVEGVMATMVGSSDPWEALLGADEDGNGALERDELLAFFDQSDGGDQVWDIEAMGGGRGRDRGNRGDSGRARDVIPKSGPGEGTLAPRFTLTSLHGGGDVSLASFKNERPVALVFGSYT